MNKYKMNAKNSIWAVFLIFLIAGCDLFDTKGLVTESGIAEEGLDLYFREYHNYSSDEPRENGADPELFLVMRTKKIMPCVNYTIKYEESRTEQNSTLLEISLKGINLPGSICLTALGPATASRYYGDAPQQSTLVIQDGSFTDKYNLKITKESVVVDPINKVFSEFTFKSYYRKPEISFYFRCGTLTSMSDLCQDFHEIMQNELNITEFKFPEDGFIPYPESSSGNQIDHQTRFYKYESVGAFHTAGELLEQFTKERIGETDGYSLSIINWREVGYRSWMF